MNYSANTLRKHEKNEPFAPKSPFIAFYVQFIIAYFFSLVKRITRFRKNPDGNFIKNIPSSIDKSQKKAYYNREDITRAYYR